MESTNSKTYKALIAIASCVGVFFGSYAMAGAVSTLIVGQGGTGINSATQGYNIIGFSSTQLQATSSIFTSAIGRIGIATTSPLGRLSISGQAGENAFVISTSSDTVTAIRVSANGNLHFLNGAGIDIGLAVAPPTDGMVTKGSVGIGSSTPSAKLSVMVGGLGVGFASIPQSTVFAIGSSTQGTATSTLFTVLSNGFVGVDVTPTGQLTVAGDYTGTPANAGSFFNSGNAAFTDGATAGSGTAAVFNANSISRSTLRASNTLVTTTQASSLEISGGVVAGNNETITTDYGLFLRGNTVAGSSGVVTKSIALGVNAFSGATTNVAATFNGGAIGIGTVSPTALLTQTGGFSLNSWTTTGSNTIFGGSSATTNQYTDLTSAAASTIGTRVVNSFGPPSLAFATGTSTVTTAANVFIGGAPSSDSASSTIITTSDALLIAAGSVASGGVVTTANGLVVNTPTGATNNYAGIFAGGHVGIGSTAPGSKLTLAGAETIASWTTTGSDFSNSSHTSTDNTSTAASTIATRVAASFGQPTFAFATGTSTITNAATVYITGAPKTDAASSTIITTSSSLLIAAGNLVAGTSVTNSFGLTVNAQTNATSNYAAQFLGGNVAIGTSTPDTLLTVSGTQGLETIDSTTANQISTLKLRSNTTGNNTALGTLGFFNTSLPTTALASVQGFQGGSTASTFLTFTTRNGAVNTEAVRIAATGFVGIATTTPAAGLDIYVASSTAGTVQSTPVGALIEMVIAGVASYVDSWDYWAHHYFSGPVPTLTSCGTSPSVTAGNDNAGIIQVGSVAATGCTITFAHAWNSTPSCEVTEQTGSVANAFSYTVSSTAIVVSQTGLTSDILNYSCSGIRTAGS